MKCEDVLSVIEEYFDGELPPAKAESVAAHVARCADCRDELESLELEQDAIFRAQILPEPSPSFWAGVEARIAVERPATAPTNQAPRKKFLGWFDGGWLIPTFASVLAVLIIGAVLARRFFRPTNPVLSSVKTQSDRNSPELNGIANRNPVQQSVQLPDAAPVAKAGLKIPKETLLPRPRANKPTPSPLFGTVRPEDLVAINSESSPDETVFQPATFAQGDPEVARHVDRVSALIRSFRNSKSTGDEAELAFERKLARDLLSQNMFLRRNSDAAGDALTVELLSTVEPILLDIANLDKRPTKSDVSTIKDRIEKDDIVATLQVR